MKSKFLLLVCLPLYFFSACGKDDNNNNASAPPPPAANTTANTENAAPENWGGSGAQMVLNAASARIQFTCSHAEINEAIVADANGNFDIPGWLVFDDGRINNRIVARFTGTMTGDTMTINVSPCGQRTTIFHLTRGQAGALSQCIIFTPTPRPTPTPTPSPSPTPISHVAKVGEWGGEHIDMMVTNAGATYQLDCGHGTIDQKISPDRNGNFHNTGTFTREGGPTPNPPPAPVAAIYDGNISGNTMDLKITTTINGMINVSQFRLFFGRVGHLVRCL
jgi:hypothetical protein